MDEYCNSGWYPPVVSLRLETLDNRLLRLLIHPGGFIEHGALKVPLADQHLKLLS